MAKRSGPTERLLQLLARRGVPGAGNWGQQEGRGVRRESGSSTCKRNTKTPETHRCRRARCAPGAWAVREEPSCSPWPQPGSRRGWRRPAGQAPTGPHESTASHAVKSWVGSSGRKGESLKTLPWPFVSWGTDGPARCPSPRAGTGLTAVGDHGSKPGPGSLVWYLAHPGFQRG